MRNNHTTKRDSTLEKSELRLLKKLINSNRLTPTEAMNLRSCWQRFQTSASLSRRMSPKTQWIKALNYTVHMVLPAFNEAESLPNLLVRLSSLELRNPLIVWVVDDGSDDETAYIAKAGVDGLNIRLLSHVTNLGLGNALQTGIKTVLGNALAEDVVVVMDADDTHDVTLIEKMLVDIDNGADIVIASRFTDGGDDSTAPPFRRFLSRGAAFVFRTFLPLGEIHDFTSGFRAYKAALLHLATSHWGERLIEEKGFACMVELLLKLRHWDPVITEVPFILRYDRKLGNSKLKLMRTLWQYLKLAVRDRLSPPPVFSKLKSVPLDRELLHP